MSAVLDGALDSGGRQRTRERVFQHIRRQLGEASSIVLSTKDIAQQLGLKPATVTYHVQGLVKAGSVRTRSGGPRGTVFSFSEPGSPPPTPATPRRGRGRGSAVATTLQRTPRAARFCPWCGVAAESAWRYCASCGEKMPARR